MKKLLTLVLAAMAFAACTQNDVEELTANRADAPETLTVGFEGGDTRIELNEALKTVWTKGDKVSVFYFSNANQKWQFQGETGERMGKLKRLESAEATAETTYNVVAYPYDSSYFLNPRTCALHATLPATQHYAVDSYGAGGNIMVAQSEFTQFSLKSVCGWLRVELTGEGQKVESITLRGNAGEQVAGLIYVDTATAEATLASEMGEASDEEQVGGVGGGLEFDDTVFTEVTLDCGDGVTLGAEATAFYIALPPQTFAEGVTIEVNCAGYKPMTLSTDSGITIERNHIKPMATVEHEADSEPTTTANQLWYTATALVEPNNTSAFNVAIVSNEWNETTGEGVITFDGELTTIGDWAFGYCDSLTSVVIPDSVTTIRSYAFYDCRSLESVTIGNSVTTIGKYAFCNCYSLTSVTIPESVTTIGDGVFADCSNLAEFKGKFAADGGRCLIKDNTIIAYAEASGTTYTIPDSVTTIGGYAFSWCYSLTSITIPDSVTTIENWAFYECDSLTSVTIPDSVTTIGDRVFSDCYSLTSVTIGDGVTAIGKTAFASCSSLAEFKGKYAADGGRCLIKDNTIIAYANASGTIYTIPDSVTTIGDYAFEGCYSLTSVTIPDSVTTIGEDAFYLCRSLTSVTIPDSVTTIGNSAFYDCDSLTSVYCEATTPPSLDDYVFKYWDEDAQEDVNIGCPIYVPVESVEAYKAAENWSEYAADIVGYNFETGEVVAISNKLFYTATALVVPNNTSAFNVAIISNEWDETTGEGVITFDGELTTIGEVAFRWCPNLTSVTIPDSITTIGDNAFYECSSLTSVTIGNSVTTIGYAAFWNCSSLTSVTIPDSVTTIGDYAFYYCRSLTSVTIGDSVTTIGDKAFYNCRSLTSVTIPDSVTTIGDQAFYGCSSLAEFKGKFAADEGRCLIVDGVLNAFAIGCGVAEYTIPDSVTTIGRSALENCDSLTSVTIPDSVTTIGASAFNSCDSLTSVTIPDSVTTIGDYAFCACYSLTSVIIPNSVMTIGDGVFADCSNLAEFKGKFAADGGRCLIIDGVLNAFALGCGVTEYTIPDSVTKIGYGVFDSCTSLTSVTIPDSVTTIGDLAFASCSSLTSVTIPDSVTTIGDWAFSHCDNLTSVTIGDSVTTIGFWAFYHCDSLTSVYCEATTPPTLGDSYVFDDNASGRKIYVPAASVEAYKAAEGWSEYAENIKSEDDEGNLEDPMVNDYIQ